MPAYNDPLPPDVRKMNNERLAKALESYSNNPVPLVQPPAVCRWTLFNNDDPGPRGRLYLTARGKQMANHEPLTAAEIDEGRELVGPIANTLPWMLRDKVVTGAARRICEVAQLPVSTEHNAICNVLHGYSEIRRDALANYILWLGNNAARLFATIDALQAEIAQIEEVKEAENEH